MLQSFGKVTEHSVLEPKFPLAAITDEFSPELEVALDAMRAIGMTGAELRTAGGKNVLDWSVEEVKRAAEAVAARGMKVISIASPLLKCVLPDAPAIDGRFQHDVFASKHTYEDQPRLVERAIEAAKLTGAPLIRVFSYWRTVEPERCFERIGAAVDDMAERFAREGLILGLENEHACNVGTGAETARILERIKHSNVKVVWDPANAYVAGETAYPDGFGALPKGCVGHVHAKDCRMEGEKPEWGPLGTRVVDWKGQLRALWESGYRGYLSLETHWPGPGGDKLEGSRICGWNLRGLACM